MLLRQYLHMRNLRLLRLGGMPDRWAMLVCVPQQLRLALLRLAVHRRIGMDELHLRYVRGGQQLLSVILEPSGLGAAPLAFVAVAAIIVAIAQQTLP
jgi:hypothetical protein